MTKPESHLQYSRHTSQDPTRDVAFSGLLMFHHRMDSDPLSLLTGLVVHATQHHVLGFQPSDLAIFLYNFHLQLQNLVFQLLKSLLGRVVELGIAIGHRWYGGLCFVAY